MYITENPGGIINLGNVFKSLSYISSVGHALEKINKNENEIESFGANV